MSTNLSYRQKNKTKPCIVGCCDGVFEAQGYCHKHVLQKRLFGYIDDRYEMFKSFRFQLKICPYCLCAFTTLKKGKDVARTCSSRCRGLLSIIEKPSKHRKVFICQGCGSEAKRKLKSSKDAGKYCSRECSNVNQHQYRNYVSRSEEVAALYRIKANVPLALRRIFVRKTLRPESKALTRIKNNAASVRIVIVCECGTRFIRNNKGNIKYGGGTRRCNSCLNDTLSANRRAQRSKRKALERGASVAGYIDPVEVLSKAKWRCYMCKVKTPEVLRGSYKDNAPEVDHVIPLSRGGLHLESNLACICRKCNREKSNKIMFLC